MTKSGGKVVIHQLFGGNARYKGGTARCRGGIVRSSTVEELHDAGEEPLAHQLSRIQSPILDNYKIQGRMFEI
jgi:hypothetical protein